MAEVHRFFDLFTPEERARLLRDSWKLRTAFLTWPTGKLKDAPSRLTNVQVLIAEKIFGKGKWRDAITVPPVPNPKTVEQCMDSSKYTPQQSLVGFRALVAEEQDVRENGGMAFMDQNNDLIKKLKDLKESDLEEHEAHYRNVTSLEGFFVSLGWTVFFKSEILPIVVLSMCNLSTGEFRKITLYSPFCFATFWNPNCTKVSMKRLRPMSRTIMQCQVS